MSKIIEAIEGRIVQDAQRRAMTDAEAFRAGLSRLCDACGLDRNSLDVMGLGVATVQSFQRIRTEQLAADMRQAVVDRMMGYQAERRAEWVQPPRQQPKRED